MLSRRSFIQTAALSLSIPAPSAWCVAKNPFPPSACRVISTGACSDSLAFARALNCSNTRFDNDEGAGLGRLMAALADARIRCLAGLTRDSDYVLMTQLALEQDFSPVYKGEHEYGNGALRHRLKADAGTLPALERALVPAARDWAGVLGRQLVTIIGSRSAEGTVSFTAPVASPRDSAGYLVSWAFARAEA